MKIMHISTSLLDGGAEATLFRLVKHEKNHQHLVVSMMGLGKYGEKLRDMGIEVYCLDMPRGRLTFQGLKQLWKILNHQQPDVVQTWMYHANLIGGILARCSGVSNIIWGIRQSNFSFSKTKLLTQIVIGLSAFFSYLIPSKIVCCAQVAMTAHYQIGFNKSPFVFIPNGYDFATLSFTQEPSHYLHDEGLISSPLPLLGMVARFDPQKDHNNLLTALALLKTNRIDFHCALIGSEMDANNIQLNAWINERNLQDHVTLLGPREDIANIMQALDIHILSSAYGEAFPNALAEAMACGTPCVATDIGDSSLIVGDSGWIIPPSDSATLANAIKDALIMKANMPDLWQARRAAAHARIVNNFSITKMLDAYNDLWQRT